MATIHDVAQLEKSRAARAHTEDFLEKHAQRTHDRAAAGIPDPQQAAAFKVISRGPEEEAPKPIKPHKEVREGALEIVLDAGCWPVRAEHRPAMREKLAKSTVIGDWVSARLGTVLGWMGQDSTKALDLQAGLVWAGAYREVGKAAQARPSAPSGAAPGSGAAAAAAGLQQAPLWAPS